MRNLVSSSFIAFALFYGSAFAAGPLDGTYEGTRSTTEAKGEARYCGAIPRTDPALFTVTDSKVSLGKYSANLAQDGSFKLTWRFGADNDLMTVTGSIKGTTLTAAWVGEGRKVTCFGAYSAEKKS